MRHLALVVLVGALPAATACSIDTEIGLAAEVSQATVTVTGTDTTQVVEVTLSSSFRVGEHAPDSWTFRPAGADVFVGETAAVQVPLDRPAGFDGELAPGEDEAVTLTGATDMGVFPEARSVLCAPGAQGRVLLRWEARKVGAAMGPIPDEIGMAEAATTTLSCD